MCSIQAKLKAMLCSNTVIFLLSWQQKSVSDKAKVARIENNQLVAIVWDISVLLAYAAFWRNKGIGMYIHCITFV